MADDKELIIEFQFRLGSTYPQRFADRQVLQQHGTLRVSSKVVDAYWLVVSAEHSIDDIGTAVRVLESIEADTVEIRR